MSTEARPAGHWRDALVHDHDQGERWITPCREHPEFEYVGLRGLVMDCGKCGETHTRDGVEVLEQGRNDFCSCGNEMVPRRVAS